MKVEAINNFEANVFGVKSTLDNLGDEDKARVEEKINEAISLIDNNRSAEIDEIEHQQKEFREFVDSIMQPKEKGPVIDEMD